MQERAWLALNQTSQLDYSNDLYEVDPTSMANMAEQCKLLQGKDANQVHRIWRRSIINILDGIYPGTKWCGHGNLASNVSDIGYYNLTDVCCREHDHCDEYILPGETKFGVHNDQQYTICSCACDKKFRKCLQKVGTFTSRAVGSLFFNVVGIHCIETRTISLAGFVLGKRATLYPPEPYNQEAKVHTFNEVLAGNVSVTSWLGSLFGGK
ncbi:uncharacterized protein LOC131931556 isoform X2 [Physella acuta]|uniref:uncharacterized protein LOC131931556 isoform X2 n=1 Tax=Physella acuta TaxID=109671 RepID=UPI0027DC1DF0|nr:uncharacterized protein LOC131931556 isoform X2 [Physella acuta]